jgi:hypothetical protein
MVVTLVVTVEVVEIVLLTVPAVLGVTLAQVLGLMVEVLLVKGVTPVMMAVLVVAMKPV